MALQAATKKIEELFSSENLAYIFFSKIPFHVIMFRKFFLKITK